MPAEGAGRLREDTVKLEGRRHAMVVHASYPVGETRVQREAAVLVADRMAVDVICLRAGGERRSEQVDGVNVRRLPIASNWRRWVGFQLLEYIAYAIAAGWALTIRHLRSRYHSVQVHNLPDFLVFSAFLPKLTGARVPLDLHDLMPECLATPLDVPMRHPLVRLEALEEQLSCAFADADITVKEGWRQRLAERGVSLDRIRVVMNVPNPDLFPPCAVDPGEQAFTVVYHGTLTHCYGVDLLVEAAAELRERVPSLRVWLLGDDEHRPELEASITRRSMGDVVRISDGMLDVGRLRPFLESADVGVVPNRSSIFTDDLLPTKLLEYVALGVPVVAAQTPMIESYFDDDMVEYFTPGDPSDLADRLGALASFPQRRRLPSEAAYRFMETHSWGDISARYADLVGGRVASPSRSRG